MTPERLQEFKDRATGGSTVRKWTDAQVRELINEIEALGQFRKLANAICECEAANAAETLSKRFFKD